MKRASGVKRPAIAALAGLLLACLLAPACVRDEVDPKWELAIRTGMPFVDAEPIETLSTVFSTEPNGLQVTLDSLFRRAFLKTRTDEHLVLETTGPQRWLETRSLERSWMAIHLVLMADQDFVLRCYPRVGDMTYYDPNFFADSPKITKGTWHHVTVRVVLFRQLSEQPVRSLRLDPVFRANFRIRIASLYVEREG
jgi:hypothetical protein